MTYQSAMTIKPLKKQVNNIEDHSIEKGIKTYGGE